MLTESDRRDDLGRRHRPAGRVHRPDRRPGHLARDDQVAAAPEPIDLRDVITAALERARRRAPKGVEFDVELNPLYVMGESDDLERAITNLLDNAVKWSPPGRHRADLAGGRPAAGGRSGTGHRRRRSAAHLRPVLPRRHRPQHPGHRPGAVDRGPDGHNGTAAGSRPDDRPRAGPSSSSSCPERRPGRTWTTAHRAHLLTRRRLPCSLDASTHATASGAMAVLGVMGQLLKLARLPARDHLEARFARATGRCRPVAAARSLAVPPLEHARRVEGEPLRRLTRRHVDLEPDAAGVAALLHARCRRAGAASRITSIASAIRGSGAVPSCSDAVAEVVGRVQHAVEPAERVHEPRHPRPDQLARGQPVASAGAPAGTPRRRAGPRAAASSPPVACS